MELRWHQNKPIFRVHLKPNQKLKYLNKSSNHTPSCFKSIYSGVFKRLAKLTTKIPQIQDQLITEIYPSHAKALLKADLLPKKVPTLTNQMHENEVMKSKKEQKDQNKKVDSRDIYFCIGYTKAWPKPVHTIIKRLIKNFGLTWLRFKMSYHRFPNLYELYGGDTTKKLNRGIVSLDFENKPCNCKTSSKINGECAYGGLCRNSCIVYSVSSTASGMEYIGCTQNNFKTRMNGHYNDVRQSVCKGKLSDSFAKYFSKYFDPVNNPPRCPTVREMCNFKILWKGDILNVMKNFGTDKCKLCTRERLEILKNTEKIQIYL